MKLFYTYKDIMRLFNYSKSKSYDIIREINTKLNNQGLRTEKGRVLVKAFEETYGIERGGGNEKNN
nr:MAG TPA: protein of unknown function (DUF3173) [Caudoviricetes sp.]